MSPSFGPSVYESNYCVFLTKRRGYTIHYKDTGTFLFG